MCEKLAFRRFNQYCIKLGITIKYYMTSISELILIGDENSPVVQPNIKVIMREETKGKINRLAVWKYCPSNCKCF